MYFMFTRLTKVKLFRQRITSMKSTNTVAVMVLSALPMKFKLVSVALENICGHMR